MSERRYNEDEVSRILERAVRHQHAELRQLPPSEGMSLAQLQEVAAEVGIAPEVVAAAARSEGMPRTIEVRRELGFPIGVGRTVQLDRTLSDAEWERLVVDLRQTFAARGVMRVEGGFRQWTNGNLQVLVEPTSQGDRVRLLTRSGRARTLMAGGLGALAMGGVIALMYGVRGVAPAEFILPGLFGAAGLGSFLSGAFPLPGWARERLDQMAGVIDRL